MTQQQLFINTATQKISGDDSQFVCDFKTSRYMCKRMVLNKFTTTNFFTNFNDGETDFTFQTADGTFNINISQIHLTIQKEWINFFNAIQVFCTFSMTLTYGKAQVTGNIPWRPVGVGWKKFGFSDNQLLILPLQTDQFGDRYYSFGQSPVYYVAFINIPNSYNGAGEFASFEIENLSSFGQRLSEENSRTDQQILFSEPINFSSLEIQIQDHNHKKVHTTFNDNTGVNYFMSLSLYME